MTSKAALASVRTDLATSQGSVQACCMVLRLPPSVTDRVSPSPTERSLPCSSSAVTTPIPASKPKSIHAATTTLLALARGCTRRCCRRGSRTGFRPEPDPALCFQPPVKQQTQSKSGRKSSFVPKPLEPAMRIPRPAAVTVLVSFTVIPVSIYPISAKAALGLQGFF